MTSANKADGCIRQKTQDFNKISVSFLNIFIVASWLMEENEFVVSFLLFIVYCLLFIVCCLLFVVCCLLFVVCCLLFVVVVVVGMEASVPIPAR